MYVNNLLREKGLETTKKFRIFVNSFFFIGPLLNIRQPQISGQQNSQDFFNMISE